MSRHTVIFGQGLAGSVLAWQALWQGDRVTVFDAGCGASASAVAAGLIMPISGRRLVRRPDYDRLWKAAESFYRRVERETSESFLRLLRIERRFLSEAERDTWQQRCDVAGDRLDDGVELLPDVGACGGLLMTGGQLHVAHFLKVTREMLRSSGGLVPTEPDPGSEIRPDGSRVLIPEYACEADRLFFCQGFHGRTNIWFPGQPDQPVRGEILRVRLQRRLSADVIVGNVWVCPLPGSSDADRNVSAGQQSGGFEYLVGATWDRERIEEGVITQSARDELLAAMAELTGERESVQVISQHSGIRAGTRQRQVLVRVHEQHRQLGLLNGLGSWGALTAPAAACELLDLQQRRQLEGRPGAMECDATARQPILRARPRSLTKLAQSIVRRAWRAGDNVLDATAGNGHDTLFLLDLAGPGKVTALDIQRRAIEATRERLGERADGVWLIEAEHAEELERQCVEMGIHSRHGVESQRYSDELALSVESQESVASLRRRGPGFYGAIMFNLGYLPRSDRSVTTEAATTIRAVSAGLCLLRPGGVLTVIAYRGHSGGAAESTAVGDFATACQGCRVDEVVGDDRDATSPVLFVFRRMNSPSKPGNGSGDSR